MIYDQDYVLERSIPEPNTGCWLWLRCVDPNGYGRTPKLAHRISYEAFVGPIQSGMQLHHRCSQPGCVNPDHLVAVTASEHLKMEFASGKRTPMMSLKTHCSKGRLFDGTEASSRTKSGMVRICRTCRAAKRRRRHAAIMAIVRSHEVITKDGEV